jgi:hypothetical protein
VTPRRQKCQSEWSEWRDISSIKNFAKEIGKSPGVYTIRLADSVRQPIPISRLFGDDDEGLLAIGESVDLARRIKDFYNAYTAGAFGRHSVGDRLFLVLICRYSSFKTTNQNNSTVQFRIMKLSNKVEAQTEEEKLLKNYFKEHGELPPLNGNMPDKNSWDEIIKM